MNLVDALQTLEANMRPNMTVECWILSNGKMMRKVEVNEYQTFARNNEEWAAAIEAWKVLAVMPDSVEAFTDKFPDTVRIGNGG